MRSKFSVFDLVKAHWANFIVPAPYPPAQKYADSFYHTRRKIIINIYIENYEQILLHNLYYIKNEKLQ